MPRASDAAASSGTCENSGFFQDLKDVFGWKLLLLVFACQHLGRGMADQMHVKGTPWLYKAYGIPAPRGQVFSAIAKSPFALRPLIALSSDAIPIFGYNKTPYILCFSLLGTSAAALIGLTPHDESVSFYIVLVGLFLITLQISVCDVLSEAKYAESVRRKPTSGPNMAAYVWGGLEACLMIGVFSGGLLLQFYGVRAVYLVAVIPLSATFIVVASGCVQEKKQREEDIARSRERFKAQPEVMLLSLFMFVAACAYLQVGIQGDTAAACATSLLLCFILLLFAGLAFTPIIAKILIFVALQRASTFKTSIAAFYFYTDDAKMYPAGPHFSAFFVFSVMGVAGAAFSWLGVVGYMNFFSSWRSRRLVVFAGTLACALHLLDAVLFSRANLRLGIPDEFFVLGGISLESAAETWMWMPIMVMFAHICPKGMEATMYAAILGARSLGGTAGDSITALLLESLGCTPSGAAGEASTFDNLWIVSVIACVVPFTVLLAISPLIPDIPQDVSIVAGDALDSVTKNSVWKKTTFRNCRNCSICSSQPNADGPLAAEALFPESQHEQQRQQQQGTHLQHPHLDFDYEK
jgi:MFS family permease